MFVSLFADTLTLLILAYFTLSMLYNFVFGDDETFFPSNYQTSTNIQISKDVEVRFRDVVGLKEVKKDLKQYINYMNNREKYQEAGFKIPKGIIFSGPPGTGKTMLSKAMAGETDATFIYVCGSDFVEVFVGVGAQRVRKLFKKARENKPCIIFFDEVDSIGRSRNSGIGNSEHDSTLNQLLEEMDGFKDNEGILVIAATNMYGSLDPALTRSGRFDRKIVFDRPNIHEREKLLHMYLDKIKLAPQFIEKKTEQIKKLAKLTVGATGADISNIANQAVCNYVGRKFPVDVEEYEIPEETGADADTEAKSNTGPDVTSLMLTDAGAVVAMMPPQAVVNSVLAALKEEGEKVLIADGAPDDGTTLEDLIKSIDEVTVGFEKKERLMSEKEKRIVAYHEAGHSLVAYLMKDTRPPVKISIIPRGEAALGYTLQEPLDKKLHQYEELLATLCVLIGGRLGEKITFNRISTGAYDDLQKMTQIAYQIVTVYGMSKKLGPMNLTTNHHSKASLLEDLSDRRKNEVDNEVQKMLAYITEFTEEIMRNHQEHLNRLAEHLLEHEEMTSDEIDQLLGDAEIQDTYEVPVRFL